MSGMTCRAAKSKPESNPLLFHFSGRLMEGIRLSLVPVQQFDDVTELLDALNSQRFKQDDHMRDSLPGKALKAAGDCFRRSRNRFLFVSSVFSPAESNFTAVPTVHSTAVASRPTMAHAFLNSS
jgi:hypothetical protein